MYQRTSRFMPMVSIALGVVALFAGADIFITTWTDRGVIPAETITVCRATNIQSRPYRASNVQIAPDGSLPNDVDPSRDVVPPYTYNGTRYPGANWSSRGQALWYAGCQSPSGAVAVSQNSAPGFDEGVMPQQAAGQLPFGLRPGPDLLQTAIRVGAAVVMFVGLAMIGVGALRSSPRPVRPYLPVSSDLSMYAKPRRRPRAPR